LANTLNKVINKIQNYDYFYLPTYAEILNVQGILVHTAAIVVDNGGQASLSLNIALPNGLYMVRIRDHEGHQGIAKLSVNH